MEQTKTKYPPPKKKTNKKPNTTKPKTTNKTKQQTNGNHRPYGAINAQRLPGNIMFLSLWPCLHKKVILCERGRSVDWSR